MKLRLLLWSLAAGMAFGFVAFRLLRKRKPLVQILGTVASFCVGAAAPVAAVAGFFLSALFEPWPLSLRQGPDTVAAREAYAQVLGETPPAGVTQLYCRREWGFGGDGIDSIRFAFRDRAIVEHLVQRLALEPVAASEPAGVRYLDAPKRWWPPAARLASIPDVYCGPRDVLWVDVVAGEAFFQRAGF